MAAKPSIEETIADLILGAVEAGCAPLRKRIEEFEARPEIKYAGAYSPGTVYEPGHLCSRGGGLWLCTSPGTTQQPGQAADRWRLIVKSGGTER